MGNLIKLLILIFFPSIFFFPSIYTAIYKYYVTYSVGSAMTAQRSMIEKGITNNPYSHPFGKFNLSIIESYDTSVYFPKDPKQAFDFFTVNANASSAVAQYNLGLAYYMGSGVEKDTSLAKTWWEKAAEHGHVQAITNLGILLTDYVSPYRSSQDMTATYMWIYIAAKKGYKPAVDILEKFDKGLPDTVVKIGRQKADKWKQVYAK